MSIFLRTISMIFMLIVLVMLVLALNIIFDIRSEARDHSRILASIEHQIQSIPDTSDNKKIKEDITKRLDYIMDTVDKTYTIELNRQVLERYK